MVGKTLVEAYIFDEETKLNNTFSDTTTYRVNEWLDKVDIERYEDLYIKNPDVQESFAMEIGALQKGLYSIILKWKTLIGLWSLKELKK